MPGDLVGHATVSVVVDMPELSERAHQCGCGFAATRDQAAALLMLVDGLKLLGRESAWAVRPETPSRAA